MNRALRQVIENNIERATEDVAVVSQQPRFTGKVSNDLFGTIIKLVNGDYLENEPAYGRDSRKRDAWLRDFWKKDPHLAGVLNGVVAIDKNRGWNLIGGRNQVIRYSHILRNAEAGLGWRRFFGMAAESYYSSDIGAVTEIGRDGNQGPLRGLYHTDPARCELTSSFKKPLKYHPENGETQTWSSYDFFRTVSMPSTNEALHQLGFCASSRVVEATKLMLAVYRHDHEQLGDRAPRGLLLLQNVSEEMWTSAMEARDADLDAKGYKYYGALAVLAGGGQFDVDAKLVALSQLPRDFDLREFVDMLMFTYALAFGYDPSEFWPVQSGALGRGRETEIQHFKATGKGGMDFVLSFQDNLQNELPDTLHFEFEQRDDTGELLEAQVRKAKLEVVTGMYESGLREGAPLIEREEARILLAEQGLIHHDWTQFGEDVEATDINAVEERRMRDRLLSNEYVVRAIEQFPQEPIVRYRFPYDTMDVLADNGLELRRRRSWQSASWKVLEPLRLTQRQDAVEVTPTVIFEDEVVTITDQDVELAIREARDRVSPEYAQLMNADTSGTE